MNPVHGSLYDIGYIPKKEFRRSLSCVKINGTDIRFFIFNTKIPFLAFQINGLLFFYCENLLETTIMSTAKMAPLSHVHIKGSDRLYLEIIMI